MDDTELTRYYYIKPSSQSVDSETLRTLWKSVSSIQFVLPIATDRSDPDKTQYILKVKRNIILTVLPSFQLHLTLCIRAVCNYGNSYFK